MSGYEKEAVLRGINKIEDRLLVSKVLDRMEKSCRSSSITYTDFLDPHQRSYIELALKRFKGTDCFFIGGYEGAERVIAVFRPDFMSAEDLDTDDILKCVHISVQGRESLTHRDYLGALMGLGIKREKIGDILVGEKSCHIVAIKEIAEYIGYSVKKVGNVNVSADIESIEELQAPESRTKEINATVASMRLDSIVSCGYGISRVKASELIKAERVSLNWQVSGSVTKEVKEGDTISLRGKGRLKVDTVNGLTRKGRISVTLKKMI